MIAGVAISLVAATVLAVGGDTAWAGALPVGKQVPRLLWQQYPLEKKRQFSSAPIDTSGKAVRQLAVAHPEVLGVGNSTVLWVAGAGIVLLGLVGVKVLFDNPSDRRGNGGSQVREFLRPEGSREEEEELRVPAEDAAETSPPPLLGGSTPEKDLAVVGEHITSVLAAAEAAASKLRADAQTQATIVREEAEQVAIEIRRRASLEAETTRTSAHQVLEEAEVSAADMRSEADRYSAHQRREADAHSAKLILEAERKAAAIADTSQERHHVVLTNIATAEERLRELAKSLRHVASALDTVVGDEHGVATRADDSLEETLRPRPHSARPEVTPNP